MLRRLLPLAVLGLCLFSAKSVAGGAVEKPFFDSNGVKIHYVVEGNEAGEPVLLIHGFTGNIDSNWGAVLPALRKDYKIIGMDCRGHGGSEKPHDPKKYGLEMVEDVVRLLDHLKIKKAHIAGYSMGASITLQVVVRHPERVKSAILGGNGMPSPMQEPFYGAIAESLEKGKGFGPLILALNPKDRPRPSDEQIKLIDGALLSKNDGLALAAVMRGFVGKEVRLSDDMIKAIKTPMVAIIGEVDPLRARVDDLKKLLPDLPVIVIPKADHITPLHRPEFVDGIKTFLDKQRAGN